MAAEIYLPKMSDHMEQGTIVRWLVKEGEEVTRGQVVLEVETDKAVGEIESPSDGILKGVRAGDGDTVPVGETIAFIAQPGEDVPALPPFHGEVIAGKADEARAKTAIPEETAPKKIAGPVLATPVARRVAKDLGVDISKVTGTGPKGRVKEDDVRAYATAMSGAPGSSKAGENTGLETTPASSPAVTEPSRTRPDDFLSAGTDLKLEGYSTVPLTHVQQITGQRMLESVHQAPHFFLQVSVNMEQAKRMIEKARPRIEAENGARLSITSLLVKTAAQALKRYPRANSSYQNNSLRLYSDVNIGVAVGTEDGLIVPVIKNADQKSLAEIALELSTFQSKAADKNFRPEELSGGTFTISNLGMYEIDVFTAIINPPQSSILAVGRIINTPVGRDDGSIALQPLMAMTLSVDHRCMDGLQGAKFLSEVKTLLEEPYLMV